VDGNHDNYRRLFAAMEYYGMQPLPNTGVPIRDGFYLAGVEDYSKRRPDIGKAVAGALPGDFVLLLSHHPDVTMVQDTSAVDLVLCGHTHGGHITFFGLWAPALMPFNRITRYGQRFMGGWSESLDGVPVYVSRGAGSFARVPRVFARPEVVLVTFFT
jgi:hypothetical protein